MKTCFKCGTSKPITEFYAHPRMADGHLGKCIACTKMDVRENRTRRSDYYRARDKERNQYPHRRAQKAVRQRIDRAKHSDKYAARVAVGNALRDGRLFRKPCERCGDPKVEAHHPDYSKPLLVIWLCRTCHLALHRGEPHEPAA